MPPQRKVRRQDSNALRFASTVHFPRNQLGFAGKEGQEDPSGHGEESVLGSGPAAGPQAGQGFFPGEQLARQGEDLYGGTAALARLPTVVDRGKDTVHTQSRE